MLIDLGGWISGPCLGPFAELVDAELVKAGDIIAVDGEAVTVTDTAYGWWWFPAGRDQGIAIGWRARGGTARGVLFRRWPDYLVRLADGTPSREAASSRLSPSALERDRGYGSAILRCHHLRAAPRAS